MSPLRACRVELIGRVEAIALAMKFERLGTAVDASVFFEVRDHRRRHERDP